MMIPAPDAFRCEAHHPHHTLVRCFRTQHDDDLCHKSEVPLDNTSYHATTVYQWRDHPRPSEFSEGPYVDVVDAVRGDRTPVLS